MGQCNVKGWGMTGTRRDAYSAERTNETFEGTPVVRMWRSSEGVDEFGAMYQVFKADRRTSSFPTSSPVAVSSTGPTFASKSSTTASPSPT